MELYYFIQQKGVKKGPFKLNDLNSESIFFDELVWRSDNDKWKKASEFEELSSFIIVKPPLTPLEIERDTINKKFLQKTIPNLLWVYFILFLIITLSSYTIAVNSWDEVRKPYIINKEEAGKPKYNVIENNIKDLKIELENKIVEINNLEFEIESAKKKKLDWQEIDNLNYRYLMAKRDTSFINIRIRINEQELTFSTDSNQTFTEPKYQIPEEIIANENINGLQQPFLFRPLYAYFSKIYLIREEQNSSGILFKKLALGTFLLMLILLIITILVFYLVKKSK